MTKKIFAMFLAVLMVISLLPTSVFAAGEKTCPGKGNHTVDNCNNTVVEVVAPTCSTKGFTRYSCNDCGETFDGSIVPATGEHTYVDAPDKAATCEADGYKGAKICSGCGKIKSATTVPALNGGKYNCQWVVVSNATCTEGGTQEWECSVCGAKKTVKIPAGDHTYTDFELVVAATAEVPGKAVRTCTVCGDVDEVVVYATHKCKYHLITIKGYEATCTTAGLATHYECRVCGEKYATTAADEALDADEIAKLTLSASHKFATTPTCADTLLQCTVCQQWVNPNVAHDIDWVVEDSEIAGGAQYVAPTCQTPGYIYDLCANCNVRHLKTLDVLGHNTVTVTVPATCISIAYTYTYCTRANCLNCPVVETVTDKNNLSYNVKVDGFVPVQTINHAAVLDNTTGFYFGFYHKALDTTLFFNGTMTDAGFLATSTNVAEATKVYLELVTNGKVNGVEFNGYRLFFYNAEGTKTYIVMNEYKNSKGYWAAKVGLTTDVPADYYQWDAANELLTYTTKNSTYRFGTYGTYGTIGATEAYYWTNADAKTQAGQVYAKLGQVGVKTGVQLVGTATFNYDGKTNAANHAALTKTVLIPAECDRAGAGETRCAACGWSASFEIPAAHSYNYIKDTTVKVNNEAAYKPEGCVDGYVYGVCSCNAFVKVVLPGYGHVMGTKQNPTLNHKVTSGYVHTDCKIDGCTYSIKGEYKVWSGVNKVYTSYAAANEAHGYMLPSTGTVTTQGNCSTARRTQYKCADCGVWVIVEETGLGYGIHKDIVSAGQYQAPTCTADGGYYTFYCTGCKAYVGSKPYSENPTKDNWNKISKTGHAFELVDEDHECKDCAKPNYYDVHAKCSNPGCNEQIMCFYKVDWNYASNGADLCENDVFEYYFCTQCNDYHMANFVEAMGHNYVVKEYDEKGNIVYTVKPTCTVNGQYIVICTICAKEKTAYTATAPHVNAAKEEFYNKCTDTVEDRHCVVCCACANKGASHNCVTNKVDGVVTPCDCVIGTDHNFDSVKMPSTCEMAPYYKKTCVDCGKIENEEQTKVNGEDVVFSGHKPAKIDKIPVVDKDGNLTGEMAEQKYPGYTYVENYVYTYYVVKNGEWVKMTETYTAKFIERKDSTYTEAGYDLMFCQICNAECKNVVPVKEGLGFEMSVSNANGAKGFTYGSLIEVVISANGSDVEFYGFEFDLTTTAGLTTAGALRYVGYEALNANFNVTVSNTSNALANGKVNVIGNAANDAAGKMQNLTVDGKTELVKLYFRVVGSDAAEYKFAYSEPVVKVVKNYKAQELEAVKAHTPEKKFTVAKYLDFNADGYVNTSDAYLAMTLITGEQPNGLTYNVVVDIDKDGVITLADLAALYDYLVGNLSTTKLFEMGISAEELAILGRTAAKTCNSSSCDAVLPAGAVYCPVCGNHQ